MYLINKEFEILWKNNEFHKIALDNHGRKCYEILFNSNTICSNCPAIKSIEQQRINENFVKLSKKHSEPKAVKILSLPIILNGMMGSLNAVDFLQFVLEKEEPKIITKESVLEPFENIENFSNQIQIPILFFNKDFRVIFTNNYAKERYQIDLSKENKTRLLDLLIFEKDDDYEKLILNVLNYGSYSFTAKVNDQIGKTETPLACKIFKLTKDEDFYILTCKELSNNKNENLGSFERYNVFEAIFDNLSIGLQIQDGWNNILFQNKVAQSIFDLNNELKNQIVKQKISGNPSEGIIFIYEAQTNPNQSFNVTVKEYFSQITNENLEFIELIDVTELENLKRTLEIYKIQLEQITKNIRYVFFKLGYDYLINAYFGSLQGVEVFEKPLVENQKINFIDIIHNDDRSKVQDVLSELFHFPNISKSIDFRLNKCEDEFQWVKGIFENVPDERGKIVFVNVFLLDINEQKRVEEQLKSSQEEMRRLALYFESLREDEKKKLAFEIHDELGHLLTAMKLEMSWILKKKFLREDVLEEKLIKLIEMVEMTIRKVRSISSQLRPSILDHFGIVAAIEWQAKEFQKQTAIRSRINLPKQEIQIDEAKSIVVFRVFQEILTNIARHANATRVDINLEIDQNNLILTVSDNGRGIKPENISSKSSLGITGMKERASSVNGKLSIHGVSNIGTTVALTIPIN